MVFLLHVGRLPLAISRIVSRNRILCEAAFRDVQSWGASGVPVVERCVLPARRSTTDVCDTC